MSMISLQPNVQYGRGSRAVQLEVLENPTAALSHFELIQLQRASSAGADRWLDGWLPARPGRRHHRRHRRRHRHRWSACRGVPSPRCARAAGAAWVALTVF
jgi:hypothetical protein